MKLRINRKYYHDCTISRVNYGDFSCYMLELPDLGNQTDISCIPEGTYFATKRMSPNKQYEVMQYVGVPGRTFIQIHIGTRVEDILGCQVVGRSVIMSPKGVPQLFKSGETFKELMALLPEGVEIVVTS